MSQDNATNKEPASEPTPKLRLRDLLWGLFFFPHVILPLVVVPGAWRRAWRIFTTFFILPGCCWRLCICPATGRSRPVNPPVSPPRFGRSRWRSMAAWFSPW